MTQQGPVLSPDEERAKELFLRHVMPELHALAKRAGEFAVSGKRTKDELTAWLIAEMRKALEIGRGRVVASGEVVPGSALDALLDDAMKALGTRWAGAALDKLH